MLKIYNTLSRKTETFIPLDKKEVKMYVCGPTVYSDIHIGNARPVIFFDTLKNYLKYLGYQVIYVSNITDVDDKIIAEAKALKISEKELTNNYTEAFIKASKSLGSTLPDQMPKATDYINEMVSYINKLIETGFAYATNSGVYFETNKILEYGELSGQNINELDTSVRIENKDDKKNSRDFTLWKKTFEGIAFKSPWGEGRPGWHTECAVMNHEIFGSMIDIHGGGSDLVFPHHENENAQTYAHDGHGLSKYWMHVGRVDMANIKMSKSLGNTILVKDLTNPSSYRLLILAHHYRAPINYNEEMKLDFIEMYDRIVRTIKRTKLSLKVNSVNEDKKLDKGLIKQFEEAMNDDINTPNVITLVLEIIKELNKQNDLNRQNILLNTVTIILGVLNLLPNVEVDDDVLEKYVKWQELRVNKKFKEADILRVSLVEEGWI
ncbi:MAG: cysteine--tRNA ligase [Acholeplasma sp.]|nr:cysteine--tRNA ligase [Acholeplasma sp.]